MGFSSAQLHNTKLGPGVVGRNSRIAWIFELVMLAGMVGAAKERSVPLIGLFGGLAFVGFVFVVGLNVYFGNKNPAAALLEGAEFLQYEQYKMAAKGIPVIETSQPPQLHPELPPAALPSGEGGEKK
jgi:hypothetical protein